MARSILADILNVPSDGLLWLWHYHWPSKLQLLNAMAILGHGQLEYESNMERLSSGNLGDPRGTKEEKDRAATIITLEEFEDVVMEASNHPQRLSEADAWKMYQHLCRFEFLHIREEDEE